MATETSNIPECSICLQSITEDDNFAECHPQRHNVSHRHAYHKSCIETWLRNDPQKRCPICIDDCTIPIGRGFFGAVQDLILHIAGSHYTRTLVVPAVAGVASIAAAGSSLPHAVVDASLGVLREAPLARGLQVAAGVGLANILEGEIDVASTVYFASAYAAAAAAAAT